MTTPNEALGGPGGNAASDPLPEATGLVRGWTNPPMAWTRRASRGCVNSCAHLSPTAVPRSSPATCSPKCRRWPIMCWLSRAAR